MIKTTLPLLFEMIQDVDLVGVNNVKLKETSTLFFKNSKHFFHQLVAHPDIDYLYQLSMISSTVMCDDKYSNKSWLVVAPGIVQPSRNKPNEVRDVQLFRIGASRTYSSKVILLDLFSNRSTVKSIKSQSARQIVHATGPMKIFISSLHVTPGSSSNFGGYELHKSY